MTRYAGTAAPNVAWDLTGLDGPGFENLIAEHLQELFSRERSAVEVEQTEASGDHGRDVIITARKTITLFGIEIPQQSTKPTEIYVECKLRTGNRLEPAFFFEFSQFEDHGTPDYYFLVTTASLTPNIHHKAARECLAKGVKFRLIDRVLLADYAAKHKLAIRLRRPVRLPDDVVVEFQSEPSLYPKERRIDVYLIVWNYSQRPRSFQVYLSANDAWQIVDGPQRISRIAEPMSAMQFRLSAKSRNFEDTDPDLEIGVTVDNRRRAIVVTAPDITFAFTPTLFGAQHLDEVHHLQQTIDENEAVAIFSITGRAGVGKSRIVHDALKSRIGKTNIDLAPIFFDATGGADELRASISALKMPEPRPELSVVALVEHLLRHAPRRGRKRVLLFEDLHHARKPVLDVLKRFVLRPPAVRSPVTLILTGRNDHTFPNDDYYSLLEVLALASRADVTQVELLPLEPSATLSLIQSTLRDAPPVVIDRVNALSENVPFYVVQAIEYLLESGIAHLVNRSEVGIPRLPSFSAKEYIPDTIDMLYALRLKALGDLPNGQAMLDFLLTQSFFGFVVKPITMEEALDPDSAEAILGVLIARRFLCVQTTDGAVTFSHENLLAVLRAKARSEDDRERAGKLVLSRPRLFHLLDDLEQGEVLFLAGDVAAALKRFDRVIAKVRLITNFSSEDLDVRFFRFIDAVFECASLCDEKPELLRNILLAKAYMGIHNYPLLLGVRACDTALDQLRRIDLSDDARNLVALEIRQLQAHGLLNMGATMKASGIMLELDQFIRTTDARAEAPELVFDVYDRLQEFYKKRNHAALAHSYGQMARTVAEESENQKLLACHAITEAGMEIYRNPRMARRNATWAHCLCKKHGAFRLKLYTRLSTYVTHALVDRNQTTWRAILPKAKQLLRDAALNNLSDSLMRAQLLVATLTYLTRPGDPVAVATAEKYVRAGIDSCAKFGNGLYIWLLYSLAGVLSDVRRADRQDVLDLFYSAFRELDQQALLFVGRKDCTYPSVFVISNILMYQADYDRVNALDILARVTDYDSERTIEGREAALLLVSKKRLFFEPTKRPVCLSDPNNRYWLPIL